MEQIIHDEKNGVAYQLVGDYYLPMLKTPRAPQIGRFGRMHYDYIRKHNKALFSGLTTVFAYCWLALIAGS